MLTNVGVVDAALRLVVGLILISLGREPYESLIADLFGWVVLIAGIAVAATGLLRYCPFYARLGTTSCAPYSHEERP